MAERIITMIPEEKIEQRVREIGEEISRDYMGKSGRNQQGLYGKVRAYDLRSEGRSVFHDRPVQEN